MKKNAVKFSVMILVAMLFFGGCSAKTEPLTPAETQTQTPQSQETKPVESSAAPAAQTAEQSDVFPEAYLGTYGSDDYRQIIGGQGDFTIEKGKVTVNYNGEYIELPGGYFEVQSTAPEMVLSYQNPENGDTGTLRLYERPLSSDLPPEKAGYLELTTAQGGSNPNIIIDSLLTRILYGVPLASYQSLDTVGEFGAVPIPDAVRIELFQGATDNYFIKNEVSATNDYQSFFDIYEIKNYDKNDFLVSQKLLYYFETKDKADQFSNKSLMPKGSFTQKDNIIVFTPEAIDYGGIDRFAYNKYSDLAEYNIVFGEHSFQMFQGFWRFYVSKPIGLEEDQSINAATLLLHKMQVSFYDSSRGVDVSGNGMRAAIYITRTQHDMSFSRVKAMGDSLIAYGYQLDETYVYTFTIEDGELVIDGLIFSGVGEINFDNYTDYTQTSDFSITVPLHQ